MTGNERKNVSEIIDTKNEFHYAKYRMFKFTAQKILHTDRKRQFEESKLVQFFKERGF